MGPRAVPARLQQVAQVYEPGQRHARLAERLGVSEEKAFLWLREARVRGLPTGRERPASHEPQQAADAQQPERAITLHEAYQVWSQGNASVRELAKAFQITYYRANQLYQDMMRAGLIQRKPKVTIRPDD